jgi:hypothetical protein
MRNFVMSAKGRTPTERRKAMRPSFLLALAFFSAPVAFFSAQIDHAQAANDHGMGCARFFL